jgi:hypothetical protein
MPHKLVRVRGRSSGADNSRKPPRARVLFAATVNHLGSSQSSAGNAFVSVFGSAHLSRKS